MGHPAARKWLRELVDIWPSLVVFHKRSDGDSYASVRGPALVAHYRNRGRDSPLSVRETAGRGRQVKCEARVGSAGVGAAARCDLKEHPMIRQSPDSFDRLRLLEARLRWTQVALGSVVLLGLT